MIPMSVALVMLAVVAVHVAYKFGRTSYARELEASRFDVADRHESDTHVFYVLVNPEGTQRTLVQKKNTERASYHDYCWYDLHSGEQAYSIDKILQARESLVKIGIDPRTKS